VISEKNIEKSTKVENDGKNLIISNPIVNLKIPLDSDFVMNSKAIVSIVAIITFLYLTIGSEKTTILLNKLKEIKV